MSSVYPANFPQHLKEPSEAGYNVGHAAKHYDEANRANPHEEGTEEFIAWREGFSAGYEDSRCSGFDSED